MLDTQIPLKSSQNQRQDGLDSSDERLSDSVVRSRGAVVPKSPVFGVFYRSFLGKQPELHDGIAHAAADRRGAAQPSITARLLSLRLLLAASLVSLVGHALLPLDQFIHRSDDAYYYFKTAQSFPSLGFWTFDGIHPTTGLQPLWAAILASSRSLCLAGGVDPDTCAPRRSLDRRSSTSSCVVLFHLLAAPRHGHGARLGRRVSVSAGICLGTCHGAWRTASWRSC